MLARLERNPRLWMRTRSERCTFKRVKLHMFGSSIGHLLYRLSARTILLLGMLVIV